LTNGEDIVAEVLDISNGRIFLDNPLKVLYKPSLNSDYLSISLMQWVFSRISKQQKFDMDIVNVLIMSEPEDALLEHYNESIITFNNKKIEDDFDDDIDFGTVEGDEGIELLKNLMDKIKGGKGKGRLH